ncbi:MAG: choice-of-anchor D domain-containing protein, partial [bacterium]
GLLLEGDNTSTVPIYNSILHEINAGIVYSTTDGTTGTTPNIFPHETTEGVNSIYLSANIAHLSTVTSPAGNLVNDLSNVPNSAYSEVGSGRIVAMADEVFENYRMSQADNQLFANQVFDWLARGISWLAVAPASGSVDPGEGEDVEVTLNSEGLIGGQYDATLVVSSNDPITPKVNVPVHLQVEGAPDIVVSDSLLYYGTVYLGHTAAETLVVSNTGVDSLVVSGLSINNPVFSTDPSGFSLGVGESRALDVVFAPTVTGIATGTLTITSNDPDEPSVVVLLEGIALEPPVISVQPDSLADSLFSGQVAEHTLTIGNTGGSALEWNIRREAPSGMQTYLYTLTTPDPNAVDEEGDGPPIPVRTEPISAYLEDLTGVRIMFDRAHAQPGAIDWETIIADLIGRGATLYINNQPFTVSHLDSFDIVWSVDLGIAFSSAELSALSGWIQSGGGLLLEGDNDASVTIFNSVLDEVGAGIVYSSTDGTSGLTNTIFPHETTMGIGTIYIPSTMARISSVVIPARRLINDPSNVPNTVCSEVGTGRIIATADELFADFAVGAVDNQLFANQVFDWLAGAATWISISPRSGTVNPGGSTDVSVILSARFLSGGDHAAVLAVENNDPVTPEVSVPVSLHVSGTADIEVSDTLIYFGTVFVGETVWDTMAVLNIGTDSLIVSEVFLDHPAFFVDPSGFTVEAAGSHDLAIRFAPTMAGAEYDTMTIFSNDPDEPAVGILLIGLGTDTQLSLLYPTGGEEFMLGTLETIIWGTAGPVADSLSVHLSRNGGASYDETLASGITSGSSFPWIVTGPATSQARIQVRAYRMGGVVATSESASDFSIRSKYVYVSPWGGNVYPYVSPDDAAHRIQDAVDAALAGDTVAVAGAEYRQKVTVWEPIHLFGGWDSTFIVRDPELFETVIKSGGSLVSFMHVDSSVCGIEGFTLRDGTGTSSSVPASGLYGGGIFSFESASIIKGNKFVNCGYADATGFSGGGGIFCYHGSVIIEDNVITNCKAQAGGGMYIYQATATISGNRVSGSTPHPDYVGSKVGGGIFAVHSTVDFSDNMVFDNDGYKQGGGIFVKLSDVTASGDSVSMNDVTDLGGGIYAEEAGMTASHLAIISNSSLALGGGLYYKQERLVLRNTIIALNESNIVGGGMYVEAASGWIQNNTIDRNKAVFGGGNIFAGPVDTLVFENNLITYGNKYGFQANTLDHIGFRYNNCFGSWPDDIFGVVPDTTNTSRNPHYADTTALDYHLLVHSGGIDTGDPLGWLDPDSSRVDQGMFGGPYAVMAAPAYVRNLSASTTNDTTIQLTWEPPLVTPLTYYAIYGDTVEGFVPGEDVYLGSVPSVETVFLHHPVSGCWYYRVSAVNAAGYGGGYSNEAGSCAAGLDNSVAGNEDATPRYVDALEQNYPNPFNPNTTVAFSIRSGVHVSLRIYDAAGRLVRVLVEGHRDSGRHREAWDGKDDSGRDVASGIYFYRLVAGTFTDTKKMVLLR